MNKVGWQIEYWKRSFAMLIVGAKNEVIKFKFKVQTLADKIIKF